MVGSGEGERPTGRAGEAARLPAAVITAGAMLGALVSAGAAVLSGLGVVAAPYGSSSWLRGSPGGLIGCDGPTVTLALGTTAGSALTAAAAGRGAALGAALPAVIAFASPIALAAPNTPPFGLARTPGAGAHSARAITIPPRPPARAPC